MAALDAYRRVAGPSVDWEWKVGGSFARRRCLLPDEFEDDRRSIEMSREVEENSQRLFTNPAGWPFARQCEPLAWIAALEALQHDAKALIPRWPAKGP
jgi:hypothetical protein